MLRSFVSPAFTEEIKKLKSAGARGTSLEIPAGWEWKKLGPKRYGVFYKDEFKGECNRQERISEYIARLIKYDARDIRIRKMSDGKYVMYMDGKIVFEGNSPKHCWCHLANKQL